MEARPIQLGPTEDREVSLLELLKATKNFTGKLTPICYATSTSTRDENFAKEPPEPLLESIVPVPMLVEQLGEVIIPQLNAILVPANSQFAAIVHPASTMFPFKRLHHLEKDNESQFEQENLTTVFKIMGYHMAYNHIQKETRRKPEYAAVFELWVSPDFRRSSFQFFASSTLATENITDFGIHSCLLPYDESELDSAVSASNASPFVVEAVVEVKTTKVLTEAVFNSVTKWFQAEKGDYVPGMAVQYVWPVEAPSNTNNDAGGAGSGDDQTLDKILRQIWGQMVQEEAEYAILTNATLSYYFFRRRDSSGDLYISPPYQTADNLALYTWLSAAFGINGVNTDKIETPTLNKTWWNDLPTFEATGIRPATLPENQVHYMQGKTGRNLRKRKRALS